MAKSIKSQIEDLNAVYKNLSKLKESLDKAKKSEIMPDFFDYLNPNNIHNLEQENNKLKNKINRYEELLTKLSKSINIVIGTLEELKK